MPDSGFKERYRQVCARLEAMPRFSTVGARAANFALEQIQDFFRDTGAFYRNIPVIHVAGTNGKGTVCSMLAAVYTQAGYSTGLYTSPHLTDVRERFRINGEMMQPEDLVLFFDEMDSVLDRHSLTFFELTTIIAFWYFNRKGVDLAIIETGLGGRLDATNIVTPRMSVITSIGFDHMEQLGFTLSAIAAEKAGILKPGIPYVTGDVPEEAAAVIRKAGEHCGAVAVNRLVLQESLPTDVGSLHQSTNIGIVRTVVTTLQEEFPVITQDMHSALKNVRALSGLQGRLEQLHPGLNLFFDGSHNRDAIESVCNYLAGRFDLSRATVVVAMMQDKLNAETLASFDVFSNIYYLQLKLTRAATFRDFRKFLPRARSMDVSREALAELLETAKTELVLFTGSFYFYSVVSEWLEHYKTNAPDK